jgi:lantibiotic modifying enzyme
MALSMNNDLKDIGKKTPVVKRNTNVTDKILETLASPDVLSTGTRTIWNLRLVRREYCS